MSCEIRRASSALWQLVNMAITALLDAANAAREYVICLNICKLLYT